MQLLLWIFPFLEWMLLQVPKMISVDIWYQEYESWYWMWVVVMVITMMDGGRVSQWVVMVPVWTRNQLPVTAAGLGSGCRSWWPHTWCTAVFSYSTRALTCLLYSSTILTFFRDILLHAHSTVVLPVVCMQICMVCTYMWDSLVFFLWMTRCPCHFMLYFFQANIAICWSDALDVDVNTMQCQCCDLIFNT